MEKLYIIVRNDLSPGLQVAQACHALREFIADHPKLDQEWHTKHKNIVVLQVSDIRGLSELADDCARASVPCSRFNEPDLGGELTAIACAPEAMPMLSSLPLALRAPKQRASAVA
jgi:peptidyl-tRNA hydrolase